MTWFHNHHWKVNATNPTRKFVVDMHSGQRFDMGDRTIVLFVCKCSATITKELEGIWTLEQLRPNAVATEADTKFLKKMRIKL